MRRARADAAAHPYRLHLEKLAVEAFAPLAACKTEDEARAALVDARRLWEVGRRFRISGPAGVIHEDPPAHAASQAAPDA